MRSFDVFDTLFARRHFNSDVVFQKIQSDSGIVDFMSKRKAADNGARTLRQIYETMAENGDIPKDSIDAFVTEEVYQEETNIFPIKETIDLVQDGDLLVSDMYMSGADILKLVRSVGMNKQVTIYQSNRGKASGEFWRDMKGVLDVEYHIGDNNHSDVAVPVHNGIKSIHYQKSSVLTTVEDRLIKMNLRDLGMLIREIRLRNHEPYHPRFFLIAHQLNLPWLFAACEILRRKYPKRNLVFLGRDCQLMSKIYDAYFGDQAYYLPFSRRVASLQPRDSVKYLQTQAPHNPVYIDISSTGRTWEKLAFPFEVCVLIYSDVFFYSKVKPVPPPSFSWISRNSEFGATNELLEVFNCGDHGKLIQINTIAPSVHATTYACHQELDPKTVALAHKPVLDAVMLAPFYKNMKGELAKLSDDDLFKLFKELALSICCNKPQFEDYMPKDTLQAVKALDS